MTFTGTFNARDYGAVGDDSHDDTAAIQAATDAAIGPGDPAKIGRNAVGEVYLPPGQYRITQPIRIYSVNNLTFRGCGASTRLSPVGKMASVIDANGLAFCTIKDFMIQGNEHESIENAIYFYFDPVTASRTSCGCLFRNIQIRNVNFATGFRVGKEGSGLQVDTSSYENITINGPSAARSAANGFMVGTGYWGNVCIHNFWNCSVVNCQVGFRVWAMSGFQLVGGSFSTNGVDFQADTNAYFRVQGIRSEDSGRLLATSEAPNGIVCNLTLADVLFHTGGLAADRQMIRAGCNGTLAIQNLSLSGPPIPVKIFLSPFRACTLLVDGATTANSLAGFVSDCSPNVDIHVRGYNQLGEDGSLAVAQKGVWTSTQTPVPVLPETLRAKNLILTDSIEFSDGRKWTPQGIFLNTNLFWTQDGLYPGMIKWKGSGTLVDGPNESLRFVGWTEYPITGRRQGFVVPPLRDK